MALFLGNGSHGLTRTNTDRHGHTFSGYGGPSHLDSWLNLLPILKRWGQTGPKGRQRVAVGERSEPTDTGPHPHPAPKG